MYLSQQQLQTLSSVMQTLAEQYIEQEVRAQLSRQLLVLLRAHHCASYVWQPQHSHFDHGIALNMDPSNIKNYEKYFQFNDPITLKLQLFHTAKRVTDVMPQRDLMRTEFFNDFLARDGLHWGVNLYAWSGTHNYGDLRIWRDRRSENFDDSDLQLLNLIRPAFVSALQRCRAAVEMLPCSVKSGEAAERLSMRERQVAQLASQGMCDKEVARKLGISVTTVRTHLNHAFRKLEVRNRTALACALDS